jgi:hypothetical protein
LRVRPPREQNPHLSALAEPFMLNISGHSFPVPWSIVGAALFVAVIHLISRRSEADRHSLQSTSLADRSPPTGRHFSACY